MTETGKRATIREVAAAAGVSVGSVSRALSGGTYVSADLRERVAAAALELGYEPNSAAQALRGVAAPTVGCIISDVSNPLYAELVSAAEAKLQEAGYVFVLGNSHGEVRRELELIRTFKRRRIDGLLMTLSDETAPELIDAVSGVEAPLVLLDRDIAVERDCVSVDHRGGGHSIVRYLAGLGHQRFLLVTPGEHVRPGRERILGMKLALEDAGLDPQSLVLCAQRSSVAMAFSEVNQALARSPRPTAVIVLGSQMLAGTLSAIASSGLRVPDDVSLVSIGDTDLARFAGNGVTALRWDLQLVGRQAAELLLARIAEPARPPHRIVFPTELIPRRSSAAPPRKNRLRAI
jgi:LacI family transcriptional regulator